MSVVFFPILLRATCYIKPVLRDVSQLITRFSGFAAMVTFVVIVGGGRIGGGWWWGGGIWKFYTWLHSIGGSLSHAAYRHMSHEDRQLYLEWLILEQYFSNSGAGALSRQMGSGVLHFGALNVQYIWLLFEKNKWLSGRFNLKSLLLFFFFCLFFLFFPLFSKFSGN